MHWTAWTYRTSDGRTARAGRHETREQAMDAAAQRVGVKTPPLDEWSGPNHRGGEPDTFKVLVEGDDEHELVVRLKR